MREGNHPLAGRKNIAGTQHHPKKSKPSGCKIQLKRNN
jgi:imidazoleglycerol phosphate synthase glutamine amidotransferase subunit HisH